MSKKKKIVLIVCSVIAVLLIAAITVVCLKLFKKQDPAPNVDYTNLKVDMNGKWYLGNRCYGEGTDTVNSFNINEVLGLENAAVSSLDAAVATVTNNVITITGTGDLRLEITVNGVPEQKTFTVVDGINATEFKHLWNAVAQKQVVVIQRDINLAKPDNTVIANEEASDRMIVFNNIYGNGKVINASAIVDGYYDVVFDVKGTNILFQDMHVTPKILTEGEQFDITTLEKNGIMFNIDGDDKYHPSAVFKNCIIENANRCIAINYADVTLEGCIIRNAADSTLSVQTNTDGTSNITLKNNVLANSLVSCITMWCYNTITDPADYVTINIEGFLDIYNWKGTADTRIVPNSEGAVASIANNLIKDEMATSNYDSYVYWDNGQKYIHCAMLIICTDVKGGGKNIPNFNGLEGVNFERRDFPMPKAAKGIIRTCELVGYNQNPDIKPNSKMEDNPYLYQELREGRKQK